MAAPSLPQQITEMKKSLIREGHLDQGTVNQLEELVTEDEPDFVENIFHAYLDNTKNGITSIKEELNKTPVDKKAIEVYLFQLKGSSVSVGARKVKSKVEEIFDLFKYASLESVKRCLQDLKQEFETFDNKMETYLQLIKRTRNDAGNSNKIVQYRQ